MIVVVDERELVKDGYTSLFGREGIPSTGFDPSGIRRVGANGGGFRYRGCRSFPDRPGPAQTLELPRAIRDRSHGAGDCGQRPALRSKTPLHFLIAASTMSSASQCTPVKSWRAPLQSAAA